MKDKKRAIKQRGFRVSERFQGEKPRIAKNFQLRRMWAFTETERMRRVQMGKCDIFCFKQITFEMLVVYPAAEPVVKKLEYICWRSEEEIIRLSVDNSYIS